MNKKKSAFDQVASFVKQGGDLFRRGGNMIQENVLWPVQQRLGNQAQKQKNADAYQRVVESRQLQAMGQIKNDPRNNNYVYRGVIQPQQKKQPIAIKNVISQPPKPQRINITSIPTRAPTMIPQRPTATPTPVPEAYSPNDFEVMANKVFQQYGIPPEIGFGMRDAEGGRIGSHNVYNIGAVDSKPTNAANYASPQAGVEAFTKLLSNNKRYSKAYAVRNDPELMLREIIQAGYAGDPKTWKQRSMATGGAGKYFNTYEEFVKNTKGWKKYHKPKQAKK